MDGLIGQYLQMDDFLLSSLITRQYLVESFFISTAYEWIWNRGSGDWLGISLFILLEGVYNSILKFCTGGCHCFVHIPGGRIPRIAGENQQETFHIWCPVVLFFQAVMNARNLCSAVLKHGWEIHDKYGATVKSSLSKWWKKNKCI